MKTVLLLVVLGTVTAKDFSVVDSFIQETRAGIKNELDFEPLNTKYGKWDPEYTKYDVTAELKTSEGKLILGDFVRVADPVLNARSGEGVLETRFFVKDAKLSYDKYTALNKTTGETSEGKLSVNFGKTEIYTLIKIKSHENTCTTSVSTLMPISVAESSATFQPSSSLTDNLWKDGYDYLHAPLNFTIQRAAYKEFTKVVAKTDLCTLLH